MSTHLYSLFQRAVQMHGRRPFLKKQHVTVTYEAMQSRVNKRIDEMVSRGLQRHHRYWYAGYNSVEMVQDALATWACGATFVPVSPDIPKQLVQHMKYIVKPFNDKTVVHPINQLPQGYPHDNIAIILFTSGTTSTPKGVVLTHENICSNLEMISHRVSDHLVNHESSSFAFLPWFHSYGFVCELLFLMSRGATIHLPSSSNPSIFIPEIKRESPTLLYTVPRVLDKIKNLSQQKLWFVPSFLMKRLFFGNRLRYMCVGGAKVDSSVLTFYRDEWGICIFQGYGLSETSPMISLISDEDVHTHDKYHTCGQLLPHVKAYTDANGYLCVHGPHVSPGYLTEENTLYRPPHKFQPDGYFNTEDICRLTNDNYVDFQYRDATHWKLENGKFVDPLHIERTILELDTIDQCCVIGNHKPHLQVCVHGSSLKNTQHLLYRIQTHLSHTGFANYEIPKKLHILSDPLSVENGTMTIKQEPIRHVLEKIYFQ